MAKGAGARGFQALEGTALIHSWIATSGSIRPGSFMGKEIPLDALRTKADNTEVVYTKRLFSLGTRTSKLVPGPAGRLRC